MICPGGRELRVRMSFRAQRVEHILCVIFHDSEPPFLCRQRGGDEQEERTEQEAEWEGHGFRLEYVLSSLWFIRGDRVHRGGW